MTFQSGGTVNGWSDEFIENNQGIYQQNNNLYNPSTPVLLLGFDSSDNEYQTAWAAECSPGLGCGLESDYDSAESKKAPAPPEITSIPSPLPSTNLNLTGYSISSNCGADSQMCHYEQVGNIINIYIDENLNSLSVSIYGNNLGASQINIVFSGQLYIGSMTLASDGNSEMIFESDTTITTKKMVWGNNAIITTEEDVLFNIIDSFETISRPTLTTTNPIFYYAPTGTMTVSATNGGDYHGCIIAKEVTLNNSVTIYGAVTSTKFVADPNVGIEGTDQCLSADPPPLPSFDVCEYFPSAIQTNLVSSDGIATGKLTLIDGDKGSANRLYLDNNAALFFGSKDIEFNAEHPNGCVFSSNGTFAGQSVEDCSINASGDIFSEGVPSLPSFEASGSDIKWKKGSDELILEPGNYKKLTIQGNKDGETKGVTLNSGEYWIGELKFESGENHYLKVNGQVILHYNKIKATAQGVYINANPNRADHISDAPDQIDLTEYSPDDLILLGHGSESGYDDNQSDTYINARWFISSESTTGFKVYNDAKPTQFIGSLSAANIEISDSSSDNYIYATTIEGCGVAPNASHTLTVTPTHQFSLLCEAPEISFTVYNEDGSVATDYDGTITATFPDDLTPENPATGSKVIDYVYTPNQGVVVVPVKSSFTNEYTVYAELTEDSTANDEGHILFGPYKFSSTPDPIKAIAGHPTKFDVQVLACKDDTVTLVEGYSGGKALKISDVTLTKPTVAQGATNGDLQVSSDENGSYSATDVTLDFSGEAKSTAYLKYMQSGSLNFTLTDPDFVCPEDYDGCEVTNSDSTTENIETLTGLINVDVRPWTFAICSPDNQDMSGDSNGGSGFVAAGEKFSLRVAPIVWQDRGSLTDDIDISSYCDVAVTSNFFLDNAQSATVLMGNTLATPVNGRLGSGIQSDDGLERAYNAEANDGDHYYSYNTLAWQEVGSLNINADTTSDYLGMDINLGYREIGRFYPHHFKLENDNIWDYADGHYEFAYMNQPIQMDYRVKAKSATDSDTENYDYFVNSLKAAFSVEAIEKEVVFGGEIEGDSLNSRISQGSNQVDNAWDKATYEFESNDFMFLKILLDSSPYLSTPDGPYSNSNSTFGVVVDTSSSEYTNDDQVNFNENFVSTDTFTTPFGLDNVGVAFMHQPDFRYGRMVLNAVSGPIGGPISVPLRIEYWDDSNFVVNEDDNGSQFKTDIYYVMSNVSGSSATLTSGNSSSFVTVSNGRSSQVKAKQETLTRETVRLFLRQGNDSGGFGNNPEPKQDDDLYETIDGWSNAENVEQPWLQFNWRNKGDEDPSTVVNFGAYRGNDRIIYRGEPNLTGK
ncbi:hypothetical protein GCM10007931_20350 [Vibrio algivorus]|uniref:DUF6701 domain-containing protein n=1 Tax=Vibrio algivorus TaxID=1667024 RepID=A0ABQ6ER07_9VIBR|nr:hypothetical protein GCM10007931_20350 [Vibrio algivorus]